MSPRPDRTFKPQPRGAFARSLAAQIDSEGNNHGLMAADSQTSEERKLKRKQRRAAAQRLRMVKQEQQRKMHQLAEKRSQLGWTDQTPSALSSSVPSPSPSS